MTISSSPSEASYPGDDISMIFPIPFVFDTSADLKVIRTDSNGNAATLSSGYSISGGNGASGNCTLTSPLATGYTLTILDNPALTQDLDYTGKRAFPGSTHEGALDHGVRISKRLHQMLLRSIRVGDGDPQAGSGMLLGSVQNRKGKYLFFNTVTGAIEYSAAVIGTTLSQSIIGQFLNPQTSAESSAGVTPMNYWYVAGDARRYGYLADGSTNNSTALANALRQNAQAGGADIYLPPGIGRFSTSLNLPTNCQIRGAGKDKTILKYTGSAQAFKQATPSSRIFEVHLSDFSLYDIGTGTVGLDLASVSTSNFERLWIDGFAVGVRIHSPTSGFAVYNRFTDVTVNGVANQQGFVLSGTSTNANVFDKCRANFDGHANTRGWEITDSNGNQIVHCHPEGVTDAIYITATRPGVTTANYIAGNRFEANTNHIHIVNSNVEATIIGENTYIGAGTIIDNGSRTVKDQVVIGSCFQRVYSSAVAANASGTVRLVREAPGGASLPFVVMRDDAKGSGTPVTLQIETERSAGFFIRMTRSGSAIHELRADGTTLGATTTVAHLPAVAQGLRTFVSDSNATLAAGHGNVVVGGGSNFVPVYSDGRNWRIG